MAIQYAIDNVQLFKGFLLVEGWAFEPRGAVTPGLVHRGNVVESALTRVDRPDIPQAFPGAPSGCGFQLRAIVTAVENPEEVQVTLAGASDRLLVPRPGQTAYANTYQPLAALNDRFFSQIRNSGDAIALEIGARARSGIVRRDLFGEQARYVGFDIVSGPNVDVVGDAHELCRYFRPSTVDFCYSISVFEHLMWPWKVALELNAIMKVGGLVLTQSHPVWPKHEMPWDFFRYWDSGWRALFCEATGFRVLETVEVHDVDLVPKYYVGSPAVNFRETCATLGSAVLAEKVGDAKVSWGASPPLGGFGQYPG